MTSGSARYRRSFAAHRRGVCPVKLVPDWKHTPIKDFVEDNRGDIWVLNQLGEACGSKDGRIVKPPVLMGKIPCESTGHDDAAHHRLRDAQRCGDPVHPEGYEAMDFGDPRGAALLRGDGSGPDGGLWVGPRAGAEVGREQLGQTWFVLLTNVSVTTVLETSSGRLLVGTLQKWLVCL